jgi:hypothetical protein
MTRLYEEVLSHLAACVHTADTVSDTWAHTLRAKGTSYSEDELEDLLEIGCRANKWIKNLCYFLDDGIIDWDGLLERQLIANLPSTGNPYCDIVRNSARISSLFLHNVSIAAEIIRLLDDSNVRTPTVLEIGGGYGVLMAVLRSYYGQRLTLVAVDLPETLCLQEWLLRKSYPDAPVLFAPDASPVSLATGGFNFFNAHTFLDNKFKFDLAINIDSMCEMPASVVDKYIHFIERNVAIGGHFLLQNCYGHSNDAYPEMFDYPLDSRWRLQKARFLHQYETMSHFPITRATLQRLPLGAEVTDLRSALKCIHGRGHATGVASTEPLKVGSRGSWIQNLSGAITSFHIDLINLMKTGARSVSALEGARDEIASKLCSQICIASNSDYWTGYIASALLPLNNLEIIEPLRERARSTASDLWKVRLTYLLMKYGSANLASDLLDELADKSGLAWFLELKLCEMLRDCDKSYQSILRRQLSTPCNGKTVGVIGRTLARLGDVDQLLEFIPRALTASNGDRSVIFDFLSVYLEGRNNLPASLMNLLTAELNCDAPPFWALAILHRTGEDSEDLFRKAVDAAWGDYFALGKAGSLAMWAGMKSANALLDHSIGLRGDNFLHHQFVGNVRLRANFLSKARENFEFVESKKPYIKNSSAKAAYCNLPAPVIKSRTFGLATELDMIFSTEQDHYHDIGPKYK